MSHKTDPIIVSQEFPYSQKRVWSAITIHDEMIQWYFDNIPSFVPEVGFETRFTVQVEDRIFPHVWKITEVIPDRKIVYEWSYDGYPGLSIVEFSLKVYEAKLVLIVTASVIEVFPDDIPEFKRESGVAGWKFLINESLKTYLHRNP